MPPQRLRSRRVPQGCRPPTPTQPTAARRREGTYRPAPPCQGEKVSAARVGSCDRYADMQMHTRLCLVQPDLPQQRRASLSRLNNTGRRNRLLSRWQVAVVQCPQWTAVTACPQPVHSGSLELSTVAGCCRDGLAFGTPRCRSHTLHTYQTAPSSDHASSAGKRSRHSASSASRSAFLLAAHASLLRPPPLSTTVSVPSTP